VSSFPFRTKGLQKKGKNKKLKKKDREEQTEPPPDYQSFADNIDNLSDSKGKSKDTSKIKSKEGNQAEDEVPSVIRDVPPPPPPTRSRRTNKSIINKIRNSVVPSFLFRSPAKGLDTSDGSIRSRIASFSCPPDSQGPDNQKEFLEAFHADSDDSEDEEDEKNGKSKEKESKKESIDHMLTENALEKERSEMAQEQESMRLQQETVEQLLHDETMKNAELNSQIKQLQEQVDNAREAAQVEELKNKNRMLEAEVECLQQKNERHQETIASLMKSGSSRNISHTSSLGSISASSRNLSRHISGIEEEGTLESIDEPFESMDDQTGYMSMSSLGARAQGELLQLRSTLSQNNTAYELQSKELANVRQELETLREEQGVKNLQTYVQNLEQEKQFFVTEIDKLQKELDASRKRERDAIADAAVSGASSSSEVSKGGWFGFGGEKGENHGKTNTSTGGMREIALPSQAAVEKTKNIDEVEDEQDKRLSTLLDY